MASRSAGETGKHNGRPRTGVERSAIKGVLIEDVNFAEENEHSDIF